ncbi:Lysosomal thioesterase PPT2-B [Chionoecetes opilio]|uniref:palmitoyl-CoA hydrolase n=1 Tax=Chionoecetes opilio TaxID=41210 RepID=A0A8J4YIZ1_CHIOP|nr:Lysosomal thioesterase PPT2-B [Chionoecetes opilio]
MSDCVFATRQATPKVASSAEASWRARTTTSPPSSPSPPLRQGSMEINFIVYTFKGVGIPPLSRRYSNYLPYLNNEVNGSYNKEYRQNFIKLKQLVLIGGPDDGVITPWQSSHYGYFDSEENITEMRDQPFYQKDLFGLRTLDAAGKVKVYEVPGVYHTHWHHNMSVIKNCILPWLD